MSTVLNSYMFFLNLYNTQLTNIGIYCEIKTVQINKKLYNINTLIQYNKNVDLSNFIEIPF